MPGPIYQLTTPPMSGAGIAALQAAMKTGRYLPKGLARPSFEGELATYGPKTAAAVHVQKFWMGYKKGTTSGAFVGQRFVDLAKGTRNIGPVMAATRQFRLRRRYLANSPKHKALVIATSQIGVKESPAGSNRVLYSSWYKMVGPWCAMFQSWCGVKAGEPWAKQGARFAYVPYMDNAASQHLYGMSFTDSPEPGDLVTYDFGSGGVSVHVGRFEKWFSPNGFYAIEGNTAVGNQSNGGEVMRRERSRADVNHFIHLDE